MAILSFVKPDHLVALFDFGEANSAGFCKGLVAFARADSWSKAWHCVSFERADSVAELRAEIDYAAYY
jgi:hypothetical protein